MAGYRISKVADDLVYITWYGVPAYGEDVQKHFLDDLHNLLATADAPLYFLSDLRGGHIDDLQTLHELGHLAQNPQWGGGASFSQGRSGVAMARVFKQLVKQTQHQDGIFPMFEQALDYLQRMKPGLGVGLDWEAIMATHEFPPQFE